jgi:uncharacterized protein (TIGR02687 family)
MKRIHDSLHRTFERHRLVFWYDSGKEWAEAFEGFGDLSVTKLRVEADEFGTKVRIVRDPNPEARFLVYLPAARPPDADNWLLDLLLQGYEYKADRASLALQEAGLSEEFRHLAEEHGSYFQSGKRVQALRDMVGRDDQARDLRLKMMSVLAGTAVEVDAVLLHFLAKAMNADLIDPVVDCLGSAALVGPFWREVERRFGYTAAEPSLRDFAVALFRGANPLDAQVALHPHARVFLQRWKDSQAGAESFRYWSKRLEGELQIAPALEAQGDRASVGTWDTFEIFEKFVLHRLCEAFGKGASASDLRATIQERRSSFWREEYKHGYAALEYAVELRELLAATELTMDSIEAGFVRYVSSWWRIDMAYRRCTYHLRRYGQVQLTEQLSHWAEGAYINNFLLPLADSWSDQVRPLKSWDCPGVSAQRRFFDSHVQPFVSRGQKVFVIVSDGLRYEAAVEFAERLRSANRYTAEMEALFGSLPSFTPLGMAALLPGRKWAVDSSGTPVTIDGRNAMGTANRAEILGEACSGRAFAIQAEDFLELNSKTEGRALMRDHDVVYVFHNVIDKIGDTAFTESRTFDAVEDAFGQLEAIIRKVANINGSNMLLTADHGFLFQQDDVSGGDILPLPSAQEWTGRYQRFAFGRNIAPNPSVKIFDSADLGLSGGWSAAFPLSLGRFPLPGSGKRYVHGGISLQEVVVPVLKIHKARTDDTGRVEVELIRFPNKITTGQFAISLFQELPAAGKVLPRTLRIGVFAPDDTAISEIKTHVFDSKDEEARRREATMVLVLSHAADAFNNRDVELRLEETLPGTNQAVVYKRQVLRLQKPFASDFDEL